MVDARVVKVTFAITGEIEIRDFGDDYVTFRNESTACFNSSASILLFHLHDCTVRMDDLKLI